MLILINGVVSALTGLRNNNIANYSRVVFKKSIGSEGNFVTISAVGLAIFSDTIRGSGINNAIGITSGIELISGKNIVAAEMNYAVKGIRIKP